MTTLCDSSNATVVPVGWTVMEMTLRAISKLLNAKAQQHAIFLQHLLCSVLCLAFTETRLYVRNYTACMFTPLLARVEEFLQNVESSSDLMFIIFMSK